MSTSLQERAEPGARAAPPPARVPGNRWSEIDAPELGDFRPEATVSAVVWGPGGEDQLALTLAGLAVQGYPARLIEVVLAEDAAPRDSLPELAGELELRLVPEGGDPAAAAAGEVLLLLSPGALPLPRLVEAHARWHHAVADAVTVGPRPALPAQGPGPAEALRAARAGELEALLEPPGSDDEPLETFLELTRGLSERRADLFCVAARANVALRAETYRRAGGLSPELPEALARLDLAYRLDAHGCVFVPEREARCLGGSDAGDWPLPDASGEHRRPHDPRAQALIPVRGFRPERSGRVFERPAMVVDLDVREERADEVVESVDAVLRGRFSDLELRVAVPDDHPERAEIAAALAPDPRVRVGPHATEEPTVSPYRVTLPPLAIPDERTFADLHGLIREEGVGALDVTVGGPRGARTRARAAARRLRESRRGGRGGRDRSRRGRRPRRARVRVAAAGPLARARRVAANAGASEETVLRELFGTRSVAGAEFGLQPRGSPAPPEATEYAPLAPATDLARERAEHLRQRARAHTNQARAERHAQHAVRERMRASQEKARADRLEARLARVSPGYWLRWRSRRVLRRLRSVPGRAGRRTYAAVRPGLVRRAVPVVDAWRRLVARTRAGRG